jgi:hypothetical protein
MIRGSFTYPIAGIVALSTKAVTDTISTSRDVHKTYGTLGAVIAQIKVDFTLPDDFGRLSKDLETAVFRVVQVGRELGDQV